MHPTKKLTQNEILIMAIVRYKASDIPQPSQEDLLRIQSIRDEDIDYSDIPPLTDDFFAHAKRFHELHRPQEATKQEVTLRIDADILAWLKQSGTSYQTRLNEILRQAMLEQSLK